MNPWKIHQQLKPGLAQMISQAWERHRNDSRLISLSPKEANELMMAQWEDDMMNYANEVFISGVTLSPGKVAVTEVFTTTERIKKEAQRRGLKVGQSLSLDFGWNFLKALDRRAARRLLREEAPYFLVLAFPCSAWSVLLNLNPPANLQELRAEALTLLKFAITLAKDQLRAGRHVIMENPLTPKAWSLPEMIKFLEEFEMNAVVVDQCRFGLRGRGGGLHKKATKFATDSLGVVEMQALRPGSSSRTCDWRQEDRRASRLLSRSPCKSIGCWDAASVPPRL